MANLILKSDEIEKTDEDKFEEKRESLLILATVGMTKEYFGQELGVEKIHKLSNKNIEKYLNRYQRVQGNRVSNVLRGKGIQLGVSPSPIQKNLSKILKTMNWLPVNYRI